MSIPHVFTAIQKDDFSLLPIKTHKRFFLSSENVVNTGSGYNIQSAVYSGRISPISAPQAANDPINSFDGSYQHVIWKSIDVQYYRFPYDPFASFEHTNQNYTFKFLNYSASILSIPYLDYGESIKPGSFEYTSSTFSFNLTDDQNGNIYDPSINTGSFVPRQNLSGYWGFNNEFRRSKDISNYIERGDVVYESRTFSPDNKSLAKNIRFQPGVEINGISSGLAAYFDGTGSILTENRQEFNPVINEDFSISFWFKADYSNFDSGSLINKRSVVRKQLYGVEPKTLADSKIDTKFESSSIENDYSPIYPYDFEFDAMYGMVYFRRSDGITTHVLSGSIPIGYPSYTNVIVAKSGSDLSLWLDGDFYQSVNDRTRFCNNHHFIQFGSKGLESREGFKGWLDEVRIYNRGLTWDEIWSLSDNDSQSLYQTAVVGNAFYKRGKIVISSFDHKYLNAFSNTWNLQYRGTYTIYQYEILTRIKKGDYNLSQNPSALQNPKTDLLVEDMVTGSLYPYATTIGYYNDSGELLAISKLNRPLKMRDDVTLNIISRIYV